MFLHADSEDSVQTGQMPRLILSLVGHTDDFVMRRLVLITVCKLQRSRSVRIATSSCQDAMFLSLFTYLLETVISRGARWLSGRVSDSGARGPGFETYRRRVVSLSKTLYSPKVLVNYPGSDGSVPT